MNILDENVPEDQRRSLCLPNRSPASVKPRLGRAAWNALTAPASIPDRGCNNATQRIEDPAVSIADIIPVVQALSRPERLELARILIDGLKREDSSLEFNQSHVYAIYTPQYAPGAAAELARALKDFETSHE